MSNIYIQEPPSNGKVLVKTTVGDIDIELWSKEAPKACRNFVQLCLEGYYDGTSFHRVVKDFIVQGGDPTDTGEGGESIYGAPFKDEFHTRLRFVRRGLVAMANGGPHDNGSQFFFTMGATPELQNKHTIFGKVVGDTLYNMLKLQEVEVDEGTERPTEPHKILSTEVLNNPFDDIVPRQLKRQKKDKDEEKKVKSKSKATKNFSLLSFGDEAEDDEEQVDKATESFRGKSKSSHDLTDDPRLSSVTAFDKDRAIQAEEEKRKKNAEGSPEEGKPKRREGEEKKTEEEEEETADKTEPPTEETVKKKSNSPEDSKKRKPDSPEENKKQKTESKPEGKRKSRFEPLESEKKKSPEPANPSSTPEDSDVKKKKTEGDSDSKKNVKDEVKEEGKKRKQESETSQDSKKRKGDDSHKEERKKRSKDVEEEERRKRKGGGKEEDGRKKRKGEEVKEEGKKKPKTEAVNSPKPAEEDKSSKDDVRQKLKKEKEESPRGKESKSLLAFVEEEKQNRMDELKKEQRKLQRDIKDSKKRTTTEEKAKVKTEDEEEVDEKKADNTEENDLLALVKKERMKYKQRKKQMGRKEDREAATMAMLARFQSKLTTARTLAGDYDDEEEKNVEEEAEDADDMSWLRHKLHFEDAHQKTKVIDANVSDNDRYTLIDPRNPLNQRRRETSKRAMRDKR